LKLRPPRVRGVLRDMFLRGERDRVGRNGRKVPEGPRS